MGVGAGGGSRIPCGRWGRGRRRERSVGMGRRTRARERAARPDPPERADAAGTEAAGRGLAAMLNPFGFQRPGRSRVRWAAIGFGVLAVVLAVLGWVTGTGAWFNSAVRLATRPLRGGAGGGSRRKAARSGCPPPRGGPPPGGAPVPPVECAR